MIRMPNFLIAGAQRSSTTWLWTLCNQHPDICMAQAWKPELKYFSSAYDRGEDWYAAQFAHWRGEPVIGEKSVTYLTCPQAAARISRAIPKCKIVLVLREPVARAWSHYRYTRKNLLEQLPFEQALIHEPYRTRHSPEFLAVARPWAYFDSGCYARHMKVYRQYFPDSMFVVFYEDLHTDPRRVSKLLFEWLGVPPLSDQVALPQIVNDAAGAEPLNPITADYLTERYVPENKALADLCGMALPPCWVR